MSARNALPEFVIDEDDLVAIVDASNFFDRLTNRFAEIADRAIVGTPEYLSACSLADEVERFAGRLSLISLKQIGLEAWQVEREWRAAQGAG